MAAANVGKYSIAKWLLDNGANVNVMAAGDVTTAAHEGAKKGHKDVLRLLLQNGADPDIQIIHNAKLRDVARGNKDIDIINLLDSFSLQE